MTDVFSIKVQTGSGMGPKTKSAKTKVLENWYPGKSYIPLLLPGKDCPDYLRQPRPRVAYSFLVSKSRSGTRVSANKIAARTRIDRTSTLPAIVSQLEALEIVQVDAEGIMALKPPSGWFCERATESEHWSQAMASFRLYLQASPDITLIQNLIIFTLHSLSTDGIRVVGQSKAGLAKMIGVSWPTVHEAIKVLEGRNVLKVLGRSSARLTIGLYRPGVGMLTKYLDAASVVPDDIQDALADFDPEARLPTVAAKEAPLEDEEDEYEGVRARLMENGIPKMYWNQIFRAYDKDEGLLTKLWKSSLAEHARNRQRNPNLPTHFGALLKHKIEDLMWVFG